MCSEAEGKHLGFYTEFATQAGEQVLMKCGISFVSIDGARNNLEQELPHWNFEKVRKEARKSWNKALSCIEVKGKSERDKRIFYTGLYHTMIDPAAIRMWMEITLVPMDRSIRQKILSTVPYSAVGMFSEVSFPCRTSLIRNW